jgi:hypothetical protein
VRTDAAGAPVLQLTGGPPATTGSAEPTTDGGALVLVNSAEPWLARLDATGAITWQRTLRYTLALPELPDAVRAVEQGDGTIVVFGTGNTPWVLLLDATGALLGDRKLSRTPSDVVVVAGEAVIFGQFDSHRGVLYRPRDLSAGQCSGGLGTTQLEVVDAAETLAPIDLGFAAAPAVTLAPSNLLSRASEVELSTSCP